MEIQKFLILNQIYYLLQIVNENIQLHHYKQFKIYNNHKNNKKSIKYQYNYQKIIVKKNKKKIKMIKK